jgi:hypothetical protein
MNGFAGLLRAAMQTMKKHFTLLTSGHMLFSVSDPRARRVGPDHRPGGEAASVIATAQTHTPTKDPDAADPQGRGVQNRGDQRTILRFRQCRK